MLHVNSRASKQRVLLNAALERTVEHLKKMLEVCNRKQHAIRRDYD